MTVYTDKFMRRFWAKVERKGDTACWPWLGATSGAAGRGKIHLRSVTESGYRRKINAYAYVVMWQLTNGPIPNGLFVLHRCDNGNCVNPAHLFLGTQIDNIRDMHEKGASRFFRSSRRGAVWSSNQPPTWREDPEIERG